MIRLITLLALVLLAPAAVLAFDCSGAETLTCNGPTLQGTIGLPPELDMMACGDTFTHHYKLYRLVVTSPQEITLTVSGTAASVMEVVVFAGCDETQCIAQSPANSSVLPPTCLEAGEYTIGLRYGVDAVFGFEVSVDCVDCEPVINDEEPWGTLKSIYR